jgi:hypothetical protein
MKVRSLQDKTGFLCMSGQLPALGVDYHPLHAKLQIRS